ncbi:nitroreductase family protein [Mangrovitalea sediminis]|uniref:nitroreductase family protein n=1 Tax=Mangrovitalea sediminis TaxID=1982043 RepID=UPI000BE4F61A|nr:nitroreductase [Mangrovitalea sediminis]
MKDIIEFILSRQSQPRLSAPAPGDEVLREVFSCALRAPDHALLKPWRYLVVTGKGLQQLGEAFAAAAAHDNPALQESDLDKISSKALRAPMIIVGITCQQEHPKVPVIEQTLSTGAGMAYLLLALEARGFSGIWRTGDMAYHPVVHERLGLGPLESITGFLYVGTAAARKPVQPLPSLDDIVSVWPPRNSH